MNGRLNKVVMTGKIMRMKTGLYEKTWYPEWDDSKRRLEEKKKKTCYN